MKTLKVAMAGFGKGGRIYNAPIISSIEGFEITRILTSSPENIKAANKDFPNAKIVPDYERLIADPEIDLVVITLPNHLHKDSAKLALEAGKHVLVEKPFTVKVNDANELIELAKKKNLILSVNHNRRFDSDIQTIQKIINEKRLGKVVEFEAHFDRFRTEIKDTWKENPEISGSGILYDLGSHLIDQALMLFGTPKELFADLRMQRENSEVVDNFELLLYYPGLKVTLKGGMLVKEPGPRYSVYGRKGTFLKYGMDPQEEMLLAGKKPNEMANWGEEPEEIWGKLNTVTEEFRLKSERGDYRKLYNNFYNAILGTEDLFIKPGEARDVIKVIELAYRSNEKMCRIKF